MPDYATTVQIGDRTIGAGHPTYFIADIAANHDGNLDRARELIFLAKEAGADCAKFQHFRAESIVSDAGFRKLGGLSHQASWKKSVVDVYRAASVPMEWTEVLLAACKEAGIEFMTAPYALDLIDAVDPFLRAYKIGSGDITWLQALRRIASKGKPVLLATGASTATEVQVAVDAILENNPALVLMQCNTNYTASAENMRHLHLRVLQTYASMYPGMPLGLSDHTGGHVSVLGAVALGARVIEKHFTDDTTRAGPDHKFAMDPRTWREMVDRTRDLEAALGEGVKRIASNEADTVVVQRRSLRTARALPAGHLLTPEDLIALRPCPDGAVSPAELGAVCGMRLGRDMEAEAAISWKDLVDA